MSWHLLLSPFYCLTELEAEAEVNANSTFVGNPLKDRIFCIDQIFRDLHKAIPNVHKFQHLSFFHLLPLVLYFCICQWTICINLSSTNSIDKQISLFQYLDRMIRIG